MEAVQPAVARPPRFAALVAISGLIHAGLVGVWALGYAPTHSLPRSSRAVSPVRMVQQGPPPAPRPKPRPAPEPDPEPEPLDEDKAVQRSKKKRKPGPPPPPPKQCVDCAMVPASTKARPRSRSAKGAIAVGVPGGMAGGVVGGLPGGVVGGVLGGQVGGTWGAGDLEAGRAVMQPLSSVMARAKYTPDPDQQKLSRTKTGLLRRGGGVNKTGFCIDKSGRTVDVRTNKKYPDDAKIDAICRQTVKTWRFSPFRVGGKPAKVCSVVRFEIEFE